MLNEDQNDPCISFDSMHFEPTTFHMHWNASLLLSIPSTASAFGINPPFSGNRTGPVTNGFLLHRGRPGRGHHEPHRRDQEHEGE